MAVHAFVVTLFVVASLWDERLVSADKDIIYMDPVGQPNTASITDVSRPDNPENESARDRVSSEPAGGLSLSRMLISLVAIPSMAPRTRKSADGEDTNQDRGPADGKVTNPEGNQTAATEDYTLTDSRDPDNVTSSSPDGRSGSESEIVERLDAVDPDWYGVDHVTEMVRSGQPDEATRQKRPNPGLFSFSPCEIWLGPGNRRSCCMGRWLDWPSCMCYGFNACFAL